MDQQGDADENGSNSVRFSLLACLLFVLARRAEEGGRGRGEEDPSSEVYSHPSITVALGEDGIAKELGKAKPQRKLSRAVVVVRQPKRYKRSRQFRLDSNLSLSSSLPRNEAVCLYIIRRCIGYSWTPTSPFYNHNPGQRIYTLYITNTWKPGRIFPPISSVYNPELTIYHKSIDSDQTWSLDSVNRPASTRRPRRQTITRTRVILSVRTNLEFDGSGKRDNDDIERRNSKGVRDPDMGIGRIRPATMTVVLIRGEGSM
jgi:hypothetical protein